MDQDTGTGRAGRRVVIIGVMDVDCLKCVGLGRLAKANLWLWRESFTRKCTSNEAESYELHVDRESSRHLWGGALEIVRDFLGRGRMTKVRGRAL